MQTINPKHLAKVYRKAAEDIANQPDQECPHYSCWAVNHAIGLTCAFASPERGFYTTVFNLQDSNGNLNYFTGMKTSGKDVQREGNNHRVIALLTLAAALDAGTDFS